MRTTSVAVIPKLLDHSYIQSSFPTIMRHLDNSIWKTPYNWRFYRFGSTKVSSLHQYIWLIIVCTSFSQTNPVFKFNLMLIEKFSSQLIYFSTFRDSVNFEVHPVLLRTSKILMKLNVAQLWRFVQVCEGYFSIFHKILVPVNGESYWR